VGRKMKLAGDRAGVVAGALARCFGGECFEETRVEFYAGGAFDVGEFGVEGTRARRVGGEKILGVVEMRRRGAWGLGDEGREGFGRGAESAGGVADPVDDDGGHRVARLDLRKDVETADDAAEDAVEVVEAVDGGEGEEELGAVGVGAGVGH
jgi:hypothetical protein